LPFPPHASIKKQYTFPKISTHTQPGDRQIRDIAIISRLHRGKREEFIKLIDHYFEKGMEKLAMNQELNYLNADARELEKIINHNILKLTGEE